MATEVGWEEIEAVLNLLAVIHRDGGRYTAQVGLVASCAEAERLVVEWLRMADEWLQPSDD